MYKLTLVLGLGVLSLSASTMAEEDRKPAEKALEKLDSNGNGSIHFAEFQEGGTELFAKIDTNSDGELSIDEFLTGRPGSGVRSRGNRGARNDSGDSDDGRPQRKPRKEQRANEKFQEMNTDGDEFISLVEFQEAVFINLDRDNNGTLTAEELRPQRPGLPRASGRGPKKKDPGRRGGKRGNRTP